MNYLIIRFLLTALFFGTYLNCISQTWIPKKGVSYRGLAVLNDKLVWASGTKGTVMQSINGGKSWIDISVKQAPKKDFRDIHAWSKKDALVMSSGDSAEFYRTNNGGKTWMLIYKNYAPGIFFDAMDFKGNAGVILGDPLKGAGFFTLLTFSLKTSKFNELKIKLKGFNDTTNSAFAASGTCVVFISKNKFVLCTGSGSQNRGKFYKIFYSNKAVTISQTELPLFVGNYAGAYSMCSSSKNNFLIVGGSFLDTNRNDSVGAYSKDGGLTWNLCKGLGGYRSCVQANGKIAVSTGSNGSDISTDGGKTFTKFESQGYNTCLFGRLFCWFVGDKGRITKIKLPD